MNRHDVIDHLQIIRTWAAVGKDPIYRGIAPGCCEDVERWVDDALSLLKEQEAEAKWIYGEDKTGVDGWHCSECNFFEPWFYDFTEDVDFIRFYGHCPNCGRKMTSYIGDGKTDDQR